MKIYTDLFFIFNTLMDMIIIIGTSLILNRRTNKIRIGISSLIGGLSSFVLFTSINNILINIVTLVIISLISFGYKGISYIIKNIFYMYILSTLLGGIFYLFNIKVTSNILLSYLIMLVISIEVIVLYVKESKKLKNNYNNYYKVIICFKDNKIKEYIGFFDSGNNLYDPYYHRPIILLCTKYDIDNYILVPYHTVSGEGLLKCIKPLYVEVGGIKYKNVLVGLSNRKISREVEVILHKDLMKG